MIMDYWQGSKRSYHHTAPINMLYALDRSLGLLLEEGLDAVYLRHQKAHEQLVKGLEALGLQLPVQKEYRRPMLNAVSVPPGIDEAAVRKRLLEEDGIEIGAGLGPLAGKIWRVGLMGHTARTENVQRFLTAMGKQLGR
jgi:alanine-glyoxylate transaminase/serine-glyoxylate transaminase/serine-pyruvate transaminase